MRSIEARIAALNQAIEAATADEHVIAVQFVLVFSLAESAALDALPELQQPANPRRAGRVTLELVESITAGELLRQRGVQWPPATEADSGDMELPLPTSFSGDRYENLQV